MPGPQLPKAKQGQSLKSFSPCIHWALHRSRQRGILNFVPAWILSAKVQADMALRSFSSHLCGELCGGRGREIWSSVHAWISAIKVLAWTELSVLLLPLWSSPQRWGEEDPKLHAACTSAAEIQAWRKPPNHSLPPYNFAGMERLFA